MGGALSSLGGAATSIGGAAANGANKIGQLFGQGNQGNGDSNNNNMLGAVGNALNGIGGIMNQPVAFSHGGNMQPPQQQGPNPFQQMGGALGKLWQQRQGNRIAQQVQQLPATTVKPPFPPLFGPGDVTPFGGQ